MTSATYGRNSTRLEACTTCNVAWNRTISGAHRAIGVTRTPLSGHVAPKKWLRRKEEGIEFSKRVSLPETGYRVVRPTL